MKVQGSRCLVLNRNASIFIVAIFGTFLGDIGCMSDGSYRARLADKAAPLVAAEASVLGVDFCSSVTPPSDDEIARTIYEAAIERSLSMLASNGSFNYRTAPRMKAMASCLEWPSQYMNELVDCHGIRRALRPQVSYYGYATEQPSVAEARARALTQCQDAMARGVSGHKCTCVVSEINDEAAPDLNQLIGRAKDALRDEVVAVEVRLKATERHRVIDLLTRESRSPRTAEAFRLSPAMPLRLGYADWSRDYDAVCLERYWYSLEPVTDDDKERVLRSINALPQGPILDCHDVSVDTRREPRRSKPGVLMEHECSFVSLLRDVSTDNLPTAWRALVSRDHVSTLWVAGTVRLSDNGIPLLVRPISTPVAMQTDRDLFLAIEMKSPDPGYGCSVSYPLEGMIFDAGACINQKACVSAFMERFVNALQSFLSKSPFEATLIQNHRRPPGEFSMQRYALPSLFLDSGEYEKSTYTLETWSDDGNDSPGNLYYMSNLKGRTGRFVYASLSHIFTHAANKAGPYVDTEPEGIAVAASVTKAASQAVSDACQGLGMIRQSVCIGKAAPVTSGRRNEGL
jgi:hypothetical protein